MHPNPAFRGATREENLQFARDRGFGIVVVGSTDGPLAAHVPFILSDNGDTAEFHLVRSNPVARALALPQPVLIAVSGPDAYVSPDWYGTEHQVPTWNYVAVHLRGEAVVLPHDDMRDHLDRLSDRFEHELLPKPPWLTTKMPDDVLARMMRSIVPVRLQIDDVQGTWKLNQNKADAARLLAAARIEADGFGSDTHAVAALMRSVKR